jgi:disulfide bond formation protein DsbB
MSTMDEYDAEHSAAPAAVRKSAPEFNWTLIALLVALATTAGSLYLSMGMGLKACPLCFYQRTFVMAIVGVLGIGLLVRPQGTTLLNLLSLPLAVGGLGVAIFHVYLELNGTLECPAGVLGLGTAPQQSLAAFLVLTGVLLVPFVSTLNKQDVLTIAGAGIVLGALFAVGSVLSSPPMPPPAPYSRPVDICKPVYTPPS